MREDIRLHSARQHCVAPDAVLWAVECSSVLRQADETVLRCCICDAFEASVNDQMQRGVRTTDRSSSLADQLLSRC